MGISENAYSTGIPRTPLPCISLITQPTQPHWLGPSILIGGVGTGACNALGPAMYCEQAGVIIKLQDGIKRNQLARECAGFGARKRSWLWLHVDDLCSWKPAQKSERSAHWGCADLHAISLRHGFAIVKQYLRLSLSEKSMAPSAWKVLQF